MGSYQKPHIFPTSLYLSNVVMIIGKAPRTTPAISNPDMMSCVVSSKRHVGHPAQDEVRLNEREIEQLRCAARRGVGNGGVF